MELIKNMHETFKKKMNTIKISTKRFLWSIVIVGCYLNIIYGWTYAIPFLLIFGLILSIELNKLTNKN